MAFAKNAHTSTMKEKMCKEAPLRANQKNRTIVMGVAILTSFITTFMGSALNLSIPSIDAEFAVGSRTVNWVVTAYMLTCTGLAIPFGYFADSGNRNRMLRIGIAIFTAASVFAVVFDRIGMLILFRGLQGVGAAMIFSTNIPILLDVFDADSRGKILGYAACANYLGLSLGPVLGGLLNTQFGWRSIFVSTAVISGLSFAGACLSTGKTKSAERRPLRHYLELFRHDPAFVCSNLAAWINYGANFSVTYLLALYLQVVQGYSSQHAGLILIAQTAVMAVLSPISGRLSDKLSAHKLSAVGIGICAAALGMLAFLTQKTSIWFVLGGLIVCGVGSAFFATPNTHAVMAAVDEKDYGIASSILSTMRSFGHTGCMLLITLLTGLYLSNRTLTEADPLLLIRMMRMVFVIFLIFCILGIFMAMKRKV